MPRRARPGPSSNGNGSAPFKPEVPGGLPYSEGKELRDANNAIPRTSSEMAEAAGQGVGGGGVGPEASAGPNPLLALAQGFTPGVPGLTAPSQRPGEPVTSGLDVGPGPGRTAVPRVVHPAPDPDAHLWARYLPAFELMASSPNTSLAFRQFYRRLRASVPPEVTAQRYNPQAG